MRMNLLQLNISYCMSINDEAMMHVAQLCPNLRDLRVINNSLITDVGLCRIARGCILLVHLNITGLHLITDVGVRSVTTTCDQLRSLRCSGCVLLTDLCMRFVPKNCPHLNLLDVSGCVLLTDVSFFVILDNYYLENVFTSFKKFVITGCSKMKENEYGIADTLDVLKKRYALCDIECNGFGTLMENVVVKKKSKILKRFPENLKKPFDMNDRFNAKKKKVVGKKGKGGKKKGKGRRKRKK